MSDPMGDMGMNGDDPSLMDDGQDPNMGGDPNAMGDAPDSSMGGDDPNAMGDAPDPSMDGDDPNAMGGAPDPSMGGGNPELEEVINGLNTEDQAAVLKYAKSMQKDSSPEMPTESKRHSMKKLVNEIVNDILGDSERIDPIDKANKHFRRSAMDSPFASPYV